MSTTILSSTFLLTVLSLVGLVFFVKAAVKDRTKAVTLVSEQAADDLLTQLQQHFAQRAYQVTQVDEARQQVVLQGFVRPSLFLAIFLTILTAIGLGCLALVLSILFPSFSYIFPGFVLPSPLAGIFYWQRAGRQEQVSFTVKALTDQPNQFRSATTVTAHRDELAELQRALQLQLNE